MGGDVLISYTKFLFNNNLPDKSWNQRYCTLINEKYQWLTGTVSNRNGTMLSPNEYVKNKINATAITGPDQAKHPTFASCTQFLQKAM